MTQARQDLTIPACLRAAASEHPDREAVIDGDLRLTYGELDARVDRFGRAVLARGLAPGSRVAVWAPNSAYWIIAALGALAAGCVLVPLNTRFKGEEARYALARARVSMLVLDDSFLDNGYLRMLRDADQAAPSRERPVPSLPDLATVVTLDQTGDDTVFDWEQFDQLADTVPQAELDRRVEALRPDDISDIMFTSGTTGDPKGAMTTHAVNLRVDRAWADMVGLRSQDRYLLVNPLFHSFGYRAGLLATLIRRATLLPQAVFDVPTTLELIQRERVTVLPGAPTVYTSILDHPHRGDYDLSSVRLAVTGGAVVPVALIERMRTELGFETVISAYGLTETCGTATVCPPDAPIEKISTTCGVAIPGVEVGIMDSHGTLLPPGQDGEVVVRGYNVMVGYFEDPEATAAAIDRDGWLHTGDVGRLDDEGYLTITDRIKDMIVVGGFNVYPAEVERALARHPHVSEAAVVGMPDPRMGEVGHAYVIPRPGTNPTETDLIAYCRENLANFKVPRKVSFVTELPRTPSGKVQKFKLRQR